MDLARSDAMAVAVGPRSGSAADRLAAHLQDAIVRGDFAVGSSLPSERELMSRFKVSRTTVREALRGLGAQGLVEVRRGRSGGSYVSNQMSKSLARSLDLFIKGQDIRFIDLVFARLAIEPAAAAQAALSRTDEQIEELRLCCVECESRFDDIDAFVEANLRWHKAVARASNNPLFAMFLASISSALHAATDLEVFDVKARKAVVGVHWQIYEAIRQGDPDAARRRMERHLAAYGQTLSSTDLSAARGA
jgi:GntR family transcriptional regulator, transcriptional repressor for pyruvate dehydrogenase complex